VGRCLDHSLANTRLEDAFTWDNYESNNSHAGKDFLKSTSWDAGYEQLRKVKYKNRFDQAKATLDFGRQKGNFPPLQRDLNLQLMDILMFEKSGELIQEMDIKIDDLMTQFHQLILSNPFDSQLIKRLDQLLGRCGEINPAFFKDQIVVQTLDDITRELAETFSYIPDFFHCRSQFFIRQGCYDKALLEYETGIRNTKNPDTKINFRKQMISISWMLDDYPKALEILQQMPQNNPHTLGLWAFHYMKQEDYKGLLKFLIHLTQENPKFAMVVLLLDIVKPSMDLLKGCTDEWETLKAALRPYIIALVPGKKNQLREEFFDLFNFHETSLEEVPDVSAGFVPYQ